MKNLFKSLFVFVRNNGLNLKGNIKPLIQVPIFLLMGLLNSIYAAAQPNTLDFEINDRKIVVTPDFYLLTWMDKDKYATDFSIASTNDPGVYACSTFCPQAALDANAVYYKQFSVSGHGTVTVYYDENGNIVGTGKDLDGDGIGDSYDNDADGDGVDDVYDAYPFDSSKSSNTVGNVQAQFSVNKSGAATYNVPIALPPGTAGVQPQLGVAYNSQAGNGLMGIAWSLSGLSAITRCPATKVIDGFIDPIDFDDNDRFCLDGQVLVKVPGTGIYGEPGTEYRTKFDGFSRIRSYGDIGGDPSHFKVWTKAGEVMEYGVTEDAKARVSDGSHVMTWSLNKLSDVHNNYFSITYIDDQANGQQYPDRIEYTGNSSQGLIPYNTIQFNYQDRNDKVSRYTGGYEFKTTKLLTGITTPAFKYVFKYQATGITKRHQLISLLQCDLQNSCLAPLKFDWQTSNEGLSDSGSYTSSLPNTYLGQRVSPESKIESRGTQITDVNGDGLNDIIQAYISTTDVINKNVYLNTGSGFSLSSSFTNSLPPAFYISKNDGDDGGGRIIDVNGDGLADLVLTGSTVYPATCTGKGPDPEDPNSGHWIWLPVGCQQQSSSIPKLVVYINMGSSWQYNSDYDIQSFWMLHDGKDAGVQFGDINGDGLVDVLKLWRQHPDFFYASEDAQVWLNTGGGFAYDSAFGASIPDDMDFSGKKDSEHHDLGTRIADINGDGMADLIQIFDGQYFDSTGWKKRVYLSDGNQFVYSNYSYSLPNTSFSAGIKDRKTSYSHNHSTVSRGTELVDLNGDGLLDLIQSWDVDESLKHHSAYLNTGAGFVENTDFRPPDDMMFQINIQGGAGATREAGTRLADINNDGLIDMVRLYKETYRQVVVGSNPYDPDFETIVNATNKIYLNDGVKFVRANSYESLLPELYFYEDESEHLHYQHTTGMLFTDMNGDGGSDLINIFHDGASVSKNVYLNQNERRLNHITTFTDSYGNVTTASYETLTNTSLYAKGSVDVNLDRYSNPEQDMQNSLYVVDQVTNSNGLGNTVSSAYEYSGMKVHMQGLGGLGFKTITVKDEQSSVEIETEYSQDYAHSGMAIRLTKKNANGNKMSESINTPAVINTDGEGSIFAYVGTSVEKTYDFDNGQLLKTETTTKSFDGSENGGNYGNPTTIAVHTVNNLKPSETFTKTTESRYEPAVTAGDQWILGRLKWSKTTSLRGGASDINSERISSFEYYGDGTLKSETILPDDPTQVFTTKRSYDVYGNINFETQCDTVASACVINAAAYRTTETQFGGQFNRFPTMIKNALGQSESRTYDDVFGNLTSLTGPNQLTTHQYFDSYGRQTRELRADSTETTIERVLCAGCITVGGIAAKYSVTTRATATAPVTEYFDGRDRKLRVETIGFSGQVIYTDTIYDEKGRAKKQSTPYASGESPLWTETHYDDYSRVTSITYPLGDIDGDGIDNGAGARTYTYNGYFKTETDTLGRSVVEETNAAGEKIKITDAANQAIEYEYNSQGDVIKTIDPNGNEIIIAYDKRGLKISMSDPDMGGWAYSYNGYGELVSQTDAKAQTITMSYDKLSRMVTRTTSEGTSSWVYNNGTSVDPNNRSVGQLLQIRGPEINPAAPHDDSLQIKDFTYDNLGRMISTTNTLNIAPYISAQSYTTSQSYHVVTGRVDSITYPDVEGSRFQVRHTYNEHGYLSSVQSADAAKTYWQGNDSNSRGQITQATLGNGMITNRDYNQASGWLLGVTTGSSQGGAIQHSTYTFDQVGNIQTRSDHRQQLNGLIETFGYDNLDRLTSSSIQNNIDSSISYPAKSYAYDALGNMTAKDGKTFRYGGDCAAGAGPHALCEVVEGSTVDAYSYDANGNMTSGGGRTVNYTSFNKPYQFIKGAEQVNFYYGAEHSRIYKVVNTTSTTYIGLGAQGGTLYKKEVDATNNKTTHLHYIFGAGSQPIASHVVEKVGTAPATTDTEYYHRDHLDSLEAVSTDNGIVTYVSHDAWGKRRNENWTDATSGLANVKGNLEYTGHERIPEIGLIHMNGRVYDPTLGRFLSADPHIQFDGDLQSYNRYSYVLNNPMRYNDPSGYWIQVVVIIMAAVGVKAATVAIVVAILVAVDTYYRTGDARMAIKAGVITYMSSMVAGAIGDWGASGAATTGRLFARAAMHAVNGGMTSAALGGDFKDGAVGSFVTTLGESVIFKAVPVGDGSSNAVASRTAMAAVVGGTASRLSGGKFSNGAMTGAFSWLFNAEQHRNGDGAGQNNLTAEQETGNFQRLLGQNNGTALVWNQEAGIYEYHADGEFQFMGKSYAGGDSGNNILAINNPNQQMLTNQGPLPRGLYAVDRTYSNDGSRLRLWPSPDNQMYGRNGFLIHGDALPIGDASQGCAIIQYTHRNAIAHGTLMWVE